jgi:hypothetical protein
MTKALESCITYELNGGSVAHSELLEVYTPIFSIHLIIIINCLEHLRDRIHLSANFGAESENFKIVCYDYCAIAPR